MCGRGKQGHNQCYVRNLKGSCYDRDHELLNSGDSVIHKTFGISALKSNGNVITDSLSEAEI